MKAVLASSTSPRLPLVALVFAFVLVFLIDWSASVRWDHTLREAVVPMDNLVESRKAFREADRFAEELAAREPANVKPELVLAKLDRAVLFGRALERNVGGVAGLEGGLPLSSAVRTRITEYLQILEPAVAELHDRVAGGEGPVLLPRITMSRLDRAAGRVEAALRADLREARTLQFRLDALGMLVMLLTAALVLALHFWSERRRQAAMSALEEHSERLGAFASALPDVALMLDERGNYLEVFGNPSRYLDHPDARRPGRNVFDVFPAEEASGYVQAIRQALAGEIEVRYEYPRQLPDGPHWFEARVCPIPGRHQVVWLGWDVSKRHRAEERVRQLSALYNLLSQVNHAIVKHQDADLLCARVCEIAVRSGGFEVAWVSAPDADGRLALRHCAGLSPAGSAALARASEPSAAWMWAWCRDDGVHVLELPASAQEEWSEVLQELGCDRLAVVSLRQGETFAGVACFALRAGMLFDAEQKLLLREVGDDLSYALGQIALGEQMREADARMRLHAAALEGIREGVIVCDENWKVHTVNPGFLRVSGYTEAELVGQPLGCLDAEHHPADFLTTIGRTVVKIGYWQGELWCRRRGGDVYPQLTSVSIVPAGEDLPMSFVVVGSDLSELHQLESRVAALTHRDPLTGLPNRNLITELLEHAVDTAQRDACGVAVLFIDLDQFKQINDGFGYPAGDELLVAVGKRLGERFRREDCLGRYGGDEFVLIVPQLARAENAGTLARDVLTLLERPFLLEAGREIFVKCSIGISVYPEDGRGAADLISHADAAMHQAKLVGRDCFRFYTQSFTQVATQRLELEGRLRRAVREGLLQVVFQPLVSLEDDHLIGAEALVRLQDGVEPRLGPAQFIPVMEQTGLIVELGAWMQEQVCRQGKAWLDEGRRFDFLAVNLSAAEVMRTEVGTRLANILEETGFPPDHLEIEITESGLMEQGEKAVEFLLGLRNLGLRLAIDDFGTGYSSLAYLKRFPVSKLKIDRSFIRDIPTDLNDMQLTTTIIDLARNLGLRVLAEGVETVEQRDFLKANGCQAMQGFLISPPVSAEEFAQRFLPLPEDASPSA